LAAGLPDPLAVSRLGERGGITEGKGEEKGGKVRGGKGREEEGDVPLNVANGSTPLLRRLLFWTHPIHVAYIWSSFILYLSFIMSNITNDRASLMTDVINVNF